MIKKVIMVTMSAVLIIGGLASCKKTETVAAYRLGVVVAQTGSYAGLGLQFLEGMDLMVDEVNEAGGINGIPLEVIVYDNKSEATETTLAAKKLIDVDQVHVLIEGTVTALGMSIVPLANEEGVPTVILSGTGLLDDQLGAWVFRPAGTEDNYIVKSLDYMSQEMGISQYATLIENSGYGQGGMVYLPQRSPDYGMTIVDEQYFDPGATDLTPQLTNIKNSTAQLIYVWGSSPTAGLAVKQARELGISLPIMATPPQVMPNMLASFEEAYEMEPPLLATTTKMDIWEQLPDSDRYKELSRDFVQLFMERYDHPPSLWQMLGAQYITFIEDGLKRAEITTTDVGEIRSQLRDALESTEGLQLLTSVYTMSPEDHFGQVEQTLVMITFENGEMVYLR
ncbi:MAG: ABC transporter substrate-binding protein [Dehalococcoidia bacterium]